AERERKPDRALGPDDGRVLERAAEVAADAGVLVRDDLALEQEGVADMAAHLLVAVLGGDRNRPLLARRRVVGGRVQRHGNLGLGDGGERRQCGDGERDEQYETT